MNVLVVFTYNYSIKTWYESGTLIKELETYKILEKKNLNFTFLTFEKEDPDIEYLRKMNIKIIPAYKNIKMSKYKSINYLKSFRIPFIYKNELKDIDLIKQNQLLGSWISIIFKLILKKPLFIRTGYDMYEFSIKENKKMRIQYLYKLLTRISLYFADLYTVSSKSDRQFLQRNFRSLSSKIKIRPNWVKEIKSSSLESRYKNKIVCLGRLEDQKNFEFIISSFSNSIYEIDIIGDGSLKQVLKKLAAEKNTAVNFLGQLDNDLIMNLLPKYRYYLTASKYEGNPKSTLEALSSGCVVFASDIQNHKEIIEDKVNGFLFSVNNKDLLETFELTINDFNLKNISLNAKNIIEKNSITKIANRELADIKMLKV
jgi:glycosyltransferase involved in cell wall biosynthesis